MGMWLAVAWAWGAGVLWQLQAAGLHAPPVYAAVVVVAAMVAAGGVLAARRRGSMARRASWLLAVLLLAWASTGWRATLRAPDGAARAGLPGLWQLELQVDELPVWQASPAPGRWRVDARLHGARPVPDHADRMALAARADGASADPPWSRVRLWVAAPLVPGLAPGQRWRMTARLDRPDASYNPGGWDVSRALFQTEVQASGSVTPQPVPQLLKAASGGVPAWRMRVRQAILDRVDDPADAGVLAGLSVGDQSAIGQADWEIFQRTGVAHLVSISGTHVLMMGWLAGWLVRRLWSRSFMLCRACPAPVAGAWAAVLGALAYAMLAGWGVPAQRTVWMMAIVTGLRTAGVAWPAPLVWSAAAAGVAVLDPWALVQPSFWLSFVAVGTLMAVGEGAPEAQPPRRHTRVPWGAAVREAAWALVRTQARVSLVLTPVALLCFGSVSLVGLLVNLLAIPWFTLWVTPLSLLGVAWPPLWDLGAASVALMRDGLSWASEARWASWPLPIGPFWLAGLAVLSAPLLLLKLPGALRWWLLPPALLCLYLPPGWRALPPPPRGHWQAVVADVGQGSAIVVQTARHTLLFDAGVRKPTGADAGQRVVVPLLGALGVHRLDRLVVSHDDIDHSGGVPAVARRLAVDRLASSVAPGHALWQLRDARGRLPAAEACEAGQHWVWDGVRFVWLHPVPGVADGSDVTDDNARSCVLHISAEDGRGAGLLLTGDIGVAEEARLLRQWPAAQVQADVLVVPHHGGATSSSAAFLAAVQPRVAVVQVGRRNSYGHPDAAVMSRLRGVVQVVHTTPECGAYVHASHEIQGQCWRQRDMPYWHPDRLHRAPKAEP